MGDALGTRRLLLRPWSENDRVLLRRLASDPRIVRYIGDGRCWSEEQVAQVSAQVLEHWRAHGFGWRVAIDKVSEAEIGFAALNYAEEGTTGLDPLEFEVGWWLHPNHWGRGLASEAGQAQCEEALGRLGAPSVIARLQPENLASAGVARRLGMTHDFDTTGRHGEPVAVYRLAKA